MGAALEITDLTLRFGGVLALDAVDLSVASNTVMGVAGPIGSGKSSLINVLTGHYPAQGSVCFQGRPIAHLTPPERARLGIVRTFQTPRVYRRMSILENMRAALHATRHLFQGPSARRREDAHLRDGLAVFGLDHVAHELPDRLTQFELRLLEMARAHVTGARLLLLDEPAAGATSEEARQLSRAMTEHLIPGRTVVLVEHRIDLLRALCTDLVVLQAGRKIGFGTPDSVLARPDIRACLMGDPVDA
ncbi:ABC transporter ATP-binding protein [Marivita hallyeonensis]|uniref:Amino acid/amide ABC transporter ATP-binding protein 1, HAAT family n=1 Tax=Marivita hallyeonensis TaxID=996342 RepID=A0A1M5SAL3_9RHOB|nr:ATP-binding cassette domain-containing protein [Marivita hallyeonensis]SHH35534.1 amino acid/amide ABC transporter ATP-binding protein 1, HAAT family [Marivita hallyeonensis]